MIDGRPHIETPPLRLEHKDGSKADIYFFDSNQTHPRAVSMKNGSGETFQVAVEFSDDPIERAEIDALITLFRQKFNEVGFKAMDILLENIVEDPIFPDTNFVEMSVDEFNEGIVERLKMVIPAEIPNDVYCILVDEIGELYQSSAVSLRDMQGLAHRTVTSRPFVDDQIDALHYADFTEELSQIARELYALPSQFFILFGNH